MHSALTDRLVRVLTDEPLSQHTTLRIGGPAKYFYEANSSEDLIHAVEAAYEVGAKYFVLGGGSNILFSDAGFDGLVIHAMNKNLRTQAEKLYVESGAMNAQVVRETVNAGLTGLEWLATIPGTIGGAIYGNAGCFGGSMKDLISKVDVYSHGEKTRLLKKDCQFMYRDSIFKKTNPLILSAELILKPGNKAESLKKIDEYIKKRAETQPAGSSAGCTFKNFRYNNEADIAILKSKVKDIPADFLSKKLIPAGWLLDQVGARGMEMGGLAVSDKHANFIVNNGKGTADQFMMLTSKLKMLVRDELGIQIQEEIIFAGF
ncbi:MAG: UDP-N-acetylmuramate dehydrogenase [Patescibacteria group bacterium]|nr:UDP-N-acetylmuramate dehydrogenase [Patescibacteria group bacterium]